MTNEALALKGQVALVAGASSGLGQATALALAQSGADVVLLARSGDDLQDVATKISQGGRRALALPGDLAHDDYIVNAVESLKAFMRDRDRVSPRCNRRNRVTAG